MIGIVVTIFGRPQYTRDCLRSLESADLSGCILCLVDDKSPCRVTRAMIRSYTLKTPVIKTTNRRNLGVAKSLVEGFDLLLKDCDILLNLDNDAIVKPNFVSTLTELLDRFPDRVVTGFNTTTLNELGEPRHPIISEGVDYVEKESCGGINMTFTRETYLKWVRPELINSHKMSNWDNNLTRKMSKEGLYVVASKPSVIQHKGVVSTYKGRVNPDVSLDFLP